MKLDATERKALVLCAFTASCICFAPAQIVSGIVMLLVSVGLYFWDSSLRKREEAEARKTEGDGAVTPSPEPSDAP